MTNKLVEQLRQEKGKMSVCSVTAATDKNRKMSTIKGWEYMPLFWMTLYLSYKCTRRCSFCYTNNQKGAEMEMSDEMFNDLLDFIPKVYNESDIRIFLLVFLGGEPLLRTDRIKAIMDRVNEQTPGMGGSIFTNADLVDSINWGDVRDITVWQTNITDIPLRELERRMDVIAKNANVQNQTIVATFDDFNLQGGRMEEFTKFGLERGHRFRYYRNMWGGGDTEYKKRLLAKYHAVLDIIEEYQSRGIHVASTNFLMDTLIPYDWEKEPGLFTPYFCGKRILSVRADGTIGPCLRNLQYSTGTIYSENPNELIKCPEYRYTYKRADAPDECKVCESRDVCHGGCPNDKFNTYGTHGGKSPFCEVYREIIPRLMAIYRRKKEMSG